MALNVPGWLSLGFLLLWGGAFTATHLPMDPDKEFLRFPHADKLAHLGIYLTLAFVALTVARAWKVRWNRGRTVLGISALLALGVFDELTQLAVRGRTASVLDWMADSVGVLLGTALFVVCLSFFRPNQDDVVDYRSSVVSNDIS